MMPTITAGSVYIRLTTRRRTAVASMSSMPPRANRIIQPAVRVVEPMNSGSTVSTTSTDFHRLVVRASRQAIGRPNSRHSDGDDDRDADRGDQHVPVEWIGEEAQIICRRHRGDHHLGWIETVEAVAPAGPAAPPASSSISRLAGPSSSAAPGHAARRVPLPLRSRETVPTSARRSRSCAGCSSTTNRSGPAAPC